MDSSKDKSLQIAAKQGRVEEVRKLVQEGANVEGVDETGRTALLISIVHGRVDVVKLLLEMGANLAARDKYGRTATSLVAVYGKCAAILKDLDKMGASRDAADNYGKTALMLAAMYGHTETLQALLDLGVDLDTVDNVGITALMEATKGNHMEAMKILLQNGANTEMKNKNGKTAEDMASESMKDMFHPYRLARLRGYFDARSLQPSMSEITRVLLHYKLRSLDISNTAIPFVPCLWSSALKHCPTLEEIRCEGTPLYTGIPYVHRSPKATTSFLRTYGEQFTTTAHLRVQLCGNYNTGKTALREGLLEGKQKRPSSSFFSRDKDESTAGAEMITTHAYKIQRKGEEQQDVMMKVIDLGGQEEYYATHHLLMPDGEVSLTLLLWDMRVVDESGGTDDPAALAVATRAVDWVSSLMSSGNDVAVMVVGTHAKSVGTDMARFSRAFERALGETVTALGGAMVVNGHDLQCRDLQNGVAPGSGKADRMEGPYGMVGSTKFFTCLRCNQAGHHFMSKVCGAEIPEHTGLRRMHVLGYYAAESPEGTAWRLRGAGYFGSLVEMNQAMFAQEVASLGYDWLCRKTPAFSSPGCLLNAYEPIMALCERISLEQHIIGLDELVGRSGTDVAVVRGALRSLAVMGSVAWFESGEELRHYVFLRPEWVLQLIFVVLYTRHLYHNNADGGPPRDIAELGYFPVADFSEEEMKLLRQARIPFHLGKKLFSKLLVDANLRDEQRGVSLCFELLRQAGMAHPLRRGIPHEEQIFLVPVIAPSAKPPLYEAARGISEKVQVMYKMDILPVAVQSALMTRLYDMHATKVDGGTPPVGEKFITMEHWLGERGLCAPVVLNSTTSVVVGTCSGTLIECCFGIENDHAFIIVEFGRACDTLFWRPTTKMMLSDAGCCISITVLAAEDGVPVGRRSSCDTVTGSVHMFLRDFLAEHCVRYERILSAFDFSFFDQGGLPADGGEGHILRQQLGLTELGRDTEEFQCIAKCFRDSNRPDDAHSLSLSFMSAGSARYYPNAAVIAVQRLERPDMVADLVKYATYVPGYIQEDHHIASAVMECTEALPDLDHEQYQGSCRSLGGKRKDVFLWYGAHWGTVHAILRYGFQGVRFPRSDAPLGKGNYFVDNSCRALQISACSVCGRHGGCRAEDCSGLYCVILARVVLGTMDEAKSYRRAATGPEADDCSSTVGYGQKYTDSTTFPFSEFVTYVDTVSCYPEYVLTIRKGPADGVPPLKPVPDARMPCGLEVVMVKRDIPDLVRDGEVGVDGIISSENSGLRMGNGDASISAFVLRYGGAVVSEMLKDAGSREIVSVTGAKGTVLWTGAGGLAEYGVRGIAHAIVIESGLFWNKKSATFDNVADVFRKALLLCDFHKLRSVAVRYPFTAMSNETEVTLQSAMMSVLESKTLFEKDSNRSLTKIYLCHR